MSDEKWLSPFRPAGASIFISVEHRARGATKKNKQRLEITRRGNKSLRDRHLAVKNDNNGRRFINGGMREWGPSSLSPLPGSDQLFLGVFPDGYAQGEHAPLNLGGEL